VDFKRLPITPCYCRVADVRSIAAPLLVTIFLAFTGYYFTHHNDLDVDRRKAQLERVNLQLKEFYGPLCAISDADSRLWIEFRKKYRPNVKDYWDPQNPPSATEAEMWRLWIREVFAPINGQIESVITTHADLMEEVDMPKVVLEFMAHAVSYKPVLKAWDKGDYSVNTSLINFPDQDRLLKYAQADYQRLKTRQAELLGALK
jgi:hypothetical protein